MLFQVVVKDDGEKEDLWRAEPRSMENNGLERYSQKQSTSHPQNTKSLMASAQQDFEIAIY